MASAERHPDDEYVQGQAVFALTRAGALEHAARAVDGCTATAWWCAMLRGHVAAESGDLTEAEEAFTEMLGRMPESVRCEWTDLSWILPSEAWDRFESDDCLEEAARSEMVWWLADPSHLLPGNEAKVTHYNRVALATFHDDQMLSLRGRVTDDVGHTRDHHGQVLRRGLSAGRYARRWRPRSEALFSVIPDAEALLDPGHALESAWDLRPSGADVVTEVDVALVAPLPNQVAFFERGDSLLAIAAVEPGSDARLAEGPPVRGAALILADGPESPAFMASTDLPRDRYVFKRMVPRGRYLVSLEVWNGAVLARTRFGHGLASATDAPVRVSDLLLYAADDPVGAESLDEALPRMRGGAQWQTGERLGLYLEVYGPESRREYDVSVSLSQAEQGGILGTVGRVFGLEPDRPVEVSWLQQPGDDVAVLGLTVELENLEPGEYLVEVEVQGPSGAPATASRRIEVLGQN